MAELRSNYRSYYGSDRKLEIVNGKVFSEKQVYITRSRSPDPPPIQTPRISRISNSSSSSKKKSWGFSQSELKRRKRVAKYKAYEVEGKIKNSFRKGFRWIKSTCSEIVYGF